MRGLSGKVAIVPGGATKIGQAVVAAFRAADVRVMVADINAEAGEAMQADGVGFAACDLRDDQANAALGAGAMVGDQGGIDRAIGGHRGVVACRHDAVFDLRAAQGEGGEQMRKHGHGGLWVCWPWIAGQ